MPSFTTLANGHKKKRQMLVTTDPVAKTNSIVGITPAAIPNMDKNGLKLVYDTVLFSLSYMICDI